jgi:hypothetical protein
MCAGEIHAGLPGFQKLPEVRDKGLINRANSVVTGELPPCAEQRKATMAAGSPVRRQGGHEGAPTVRPKVFFNVRTGNYNAIASPDNDAIVTALRTCSPVADKIIQAIALLNSPFIAPVRQDLGAAVYHYLLIAQKAPAATDAISINVRNALAAAPIEIYAPESGQSLAAAATTPEGALQHFLQVYDRVVSLPLLVHIRFFLDTIARLQGQIVGLHGQVAGLRDEVELLQTEKASLQELTAGLLEENAALRAASDAGSSSISGITEDDAASAPSEGAAAGGGGASSTLGPLPIAPPPPPTLPTPSPAGLGVKTA